MNCGLPYSLFCLDTILPDDQWTAITGLTDGSGLLCAMCIVERAAQLPHITVARLTLE